MGGATISFKIMLEGILQKGYSAVVLVSSRNQNQTFIKYLAKKGCIVEEFDAEMSIYPYVNPKNPVELFIKYPYRAANKLIGLLVSHRQVRNLIKKHKPDLVHTNVGVFPQGLEYCLANDIPHVWHLREYQTKDFGWKIFPTTPRFKKLIRKTNVITITRDILEYFDLSENPKARSMWNGILPKASAEYVHTKDNFFLIANRISPEKSIETAIEAFAKVADEIPEYKLLIAGEILNQAYYNKLQTLVKETGFQSKIEFLGYRTDITELMKKACALIVPSIYEGLGRMTIEASFKGCLVLGRNTGGTKEVLDVTRGGFLFQSTKELENFMLKIAGMKGTDEYKSMVLNAQKIAVTHCSEENYCDKIHSIYQELIRAK